MFDKNGFRSSLGWLFAFADGILILAGIVLGIQIRFWKDNSFIYTTNYLALKLMVIVLAVQVSFYYFDLYESRIFRERKRMGFLLLAALGISSIMLAIMYYLIPHLMVGRGIFAISLSLILALTYSWRILYAYLLKSWAPKERILIIGTGELAKKVKGEILDNGYEGFEIVGFIDENRDKIGRGV